MISIYAIIMLTLFPIIVRQLVKVHELYCNNIISSATTPYSLNDNDDIIYLFRMAQLNTVYVH